MPDRNKNPEKTNQPLASNGLLTAIVTRERFAEKSGMGIETKVFDDSLTQFIKLVEQQGADPVEVLEESKRLLEKGIDRLKSKK